MEEVNAYIESGVLELYVLGQLNADERHEVEVMMAKHPAVKQEVDAIERALEQYANANAIEPSRGLDLSLFDTAEITEPEVMIVPMQQVSSSNRTLRYALVACVALLIVSCFALFSMYNKLGSARAEIAELNLERTRFVRNATFMEEQNKELKLIAAMPTHPDWKQVKLSGVGKTPEANLEVYWNKKDNKVMVNKNNSVLPKHDANHQFQLWALVDGKPVDLGVFDSVENGAKLIQEMKAIAGAQAFAVTIEKLGGSPTPTMEQMVVMGGV